MSTSPSKGHREAEPQYMSNMLKHTRECLDEMRNKKEQPANILILFGRPRCGKSRFFKCIADTVPPSTQEIAQFRIERVEINGKLYFIMDTPSFHAGKEQEVFLEILRGIEAVRPYATILGVMLVTRIDNSSTEAADTKLVGFLRNFCGNEYMAQVTVVTTLWNTAQGRDTMDSSQEFQIFIEGWKTALGEEVNHYQYGRQYQNGIGTGKCLRWDLDHDDIKRSAMLMISRHYGSVHPRDPGIVKELAAGVLPGSTAAGLSLGLATTAGSHSTSNDAQTGSAEEPGSSTLPQDDSGTRPDEDLGTSSSTNRVPDPDIHERTSNQDSSQGWQHTSPQSESVWTQLARAGIWTVDNVAVPLIQKVAVPALETYLNDGTVRGAGRRGNGGFPSWLDPNSSADIFKARGMASDLPARTKWAREHGIFFEPGSADFGHAVRKSLMREHPF